MNPPPVLDTARREPCQNDGHLPRVLPPRCSTPTSHHTAKKLSALVAEETDCRYPCKAVWACRTKTTITRDGLVADVADPGLPLGAEWGRLQAGKRKTEPPAISGVSKWEGIRWARKQQYPGGEERNFFQAQDASQGIIGLGIFGLWVPETSWGHMPFNAAPIVHSV